jgi:hypothetical protein
MVCSQLPSVNLSICATLDEQMDLDICQQVVSYFNDQVNGAQAILNPEARQIAFVAYSLAPTCHILKEVLPYMTMALQNARQLFMEFYWTPLYRKSIKTK